MGVKLAKKHRIKKQHVGIMLVPTSQCDTGCSHCIDDSGCKNPIHFTEKFAKLIVSQARKEKFELSVLLTGGGEPLMTPEFLKIADVFGNYKKLLTFGIITSGFTENEFQRKSQLETLLKRPYAEKLIVEQSFNLYHQTFPERLANMTQLMMRLGKTDFYVRMCTSATNFYQTHRKLEEVLQEIAKKIKGRAFQLPIEDTSLEDEPLDFIRENVSERLTVEAFFSPQWHILQTKKEVFAIIANSFFLTREGRASKLKEDSLDYCVCDSLKTFSDYDVSLFIAPDGTVYPECPCFPDKRMQLGKIGEDSLVEIVRRKQIFNQRIFQEILADRRMSQWATRETCKLCRQLVAEKGISLGL